MRKSNTTRIQSLSLTFEDTDEPVALEDTMPITPDNSEALSDNVREALIKYFISTARANKIATEFSHRMTEAIRKEIEATKRQMEALQAKNDALSREVDALLRLSEIPGLSRGLIEWLKEKAGRQG
jgi:pyrroloquinoline quinone (PQQ) biosynthesis protein C